MRGKPADDRDRYSRPSSIISTVAFATSSVRFLAQVRPGTTATESEAKLRGRCPVCAASLWYFAESPTYPRWTAEEIPQIFEWPRRYFRGLRPRTGKPPRVAS